MNSPRRRAPDQCGGRAPAHTIALMRTLGVVVAHEAIELPLQGRPTGEVSSSEHHAPEFLKTRALQPFDKPVGPGMARFRPRVPEAQLATGDIKRPLELRAPVGEPG